MLRLVHVRMVTTEQNWQKNRVESGCTIETMIRAPLSKGWLFCHTSKKPKFDHILDEPMLIAILVLHGYGRNNRFTFKRKISWTQQKRLAQCGKLLENAITLKNFPWNQLFSNLFSKNVDLTEKMLIFAQKSWSLFIALLHTHCGVYEIFVPWFLVNKEFYCKSKIDFTK